MRQKNSWLLPEGIEEVLPEDALHQEQLRRSILDMFASWGYELVIPPAIDYLDSLLTGSGCDLDLQILKVTDQISGEMLGIRADMTPQVARIDAHNLKHERPTRLCYAGTTLLAQGEGLHKSRSPMQIGAELYGHSGKESDLEVIRVMLEMLAVTGLQGVHLDIGHVGIYRALSRQAGLTEQQESDLFDILQRKARTELAEQVSALAIESDLKDVFLALPQLNGGIDVLEHARKILAKANAEVLSALDEMQAIAQSLMQLFPELPVSFDLAELRGYHYHTGIVFAAFVPKMGKEIARGGRYDNIGAIFGRERPATGFSADLKVLSALSKEDSAENQTEIIFAPYVDDDTQYNAIRELRAQKRIVIQQLPDQTGSMEDFACTCILQKDAQNWVVVPLD